MILNTQWIPVDVCPVSHSSIDWNYPTWYYIILFWIDIVINNITPPPPVVIKILESDNHSSCGRGVNKLYPHALENVFVKIIFMLINYIFFLSTTTISNTYYCKFNLFIKWLKHFFVGGIMVENPKCCKKDYDFWTFWWYYFPNNLFSVGPHLIIIRPIDASGPQLSLSFTNWSIRTILWNGNT